MFMQWYGFFGQRYTVRMLFLTAGNETHELVAYKKTLKDMEKNVDDDDVQLTESIVEKRLSHLLTRNDTEVHWFISKNEKDEGKKIITYIS